MHVMQKTNQLFSPARAHCYLTKNLEIGTYIGPKAKRLTLFVVYNHRFSVRRKTFC
jgi:hypothetical protein